MALKPGPLPHSLLLELTELAVSAGELVEAIESSNYLPDEFPVDALLDMAHVLGGLVTGSPEGCRVPLEYGRARLPAIRREYVRLGSAGNTDEPSIERGGRIDLSLAKVIAAVTTALDEYRSLASVSIDQEIDVGPTARNDNSKDISSAYAAASDLEKALGVASGEFHTIRMPESVRADALEKALLDAKAVSALARVELRMPRLVIRWLSGLGRGLRRLPSAIRAAGAAIRLTSDVASIAAGRWSEFWGNAEQFLISEVGKTGDALVAVADKLEGKADAASPRIMWRDLEEFTSWLVRFVSEQSDDWYGIHFQRILDEIVQISEERPNNVAKSLGFKGVLELIRSVDGIFVISGSGGLRYCSSYPLSIVEGRVDENSKRILKFVSSYIGVRGRATMKAITSDFKKNFRGPDRLISLDEGSLRRLMIESGEFYSARIGNFEYWSIPPQQERFNFSGSEVDGDRL